MLVGYARVSSESQNLERQLEEFSKIGVEKIFQEKKSGKNMQGRGELLKALEFVREGDTLVVEDLSRLGRNYDQIKEMVQQLDNKSVVLRVLNLPALNQEFGDPNLQKFIRDMLIQTLAWASQNERLENKRKQLQGIEIAKKNGVYAGKGRRTAYGTNAKDRQKRLVYQSVIDKLNKGVAISRIAKELDISRPTVYKIKYEYEQQHEKSNATL